LNLRFKSCSRWDACTYFLSASSKTLSVLERPDASSQRDLRPAPRKTGSLTQMGVMLKDTKTPLRTPGLFLFLISLIIRYTIANYYYLRRCIPYVNTTHISVRNLSYWIRSCRLNETVIASIVCPDYKGNGGTGFGTKLVGFPVDGNFF